MPRVATGPRPKEVRRTTTEVFDSENVPVEQPERPSIWDYMAGLSPEEWNNHVVYLYRTEPRTPGMRGEGKYLCIYTSPFTIEDVKKKYGGEQFRAVMKKDNERLYDVRFDVEAAPRYDLERERPTIVQGQDTMVSEIVGRVLDMLREERDLREVRGGGDAQAIDSAIAMLSKGSEAAIQMIARATPQQPGITDLVTALASLDKMRSGQGEGGVLQTIQMLRELGLIGAQAQARNYVEEFRAMLEIARELNPGGGGARGIGELLVEQAPKLAESVVSIFDKYLEIEKLRTVRVQQQLPPSAARPGTSRPQTVPSASPNPRPVPATATEPAGNGEPGAPPQMTPEQYSFWLTQQIVRLYMEGRNGDEVAEWLDNTDPQTATQLGAYPQQSLAALIQQHPVLRQMAAGPDAATRLPTFISEFLDYFKPEDVQGKAEQERPN